MEDSDLSEEGPVEMVDSGEDSAVPESLDTESLMDE